MLNKLAYFIFQSVQEHLVEYEKFVSGQNQCVNKSKHSNKTSKFIPD